MRSSRPIALALLAVGPAGALGCPGARAWYPRLQGLVTVTALTGWCWSDASCWADSGARAESRLTAQRAAATIGRTTKDGDDGASARVANEPRASPDGGSGQDRAPSDPSRAGGAKRRVSRA